MSYSNDNVEEVKRRIDIVEVISAYVSLKKAGTVYKGLCPFHNEKTPSFSVNPDKGVWYCFGQCGEGGDVFRFVQKIENLSFREALERLAQRAGVTLVETAAASGGASVSPESARKQRLYKALDLAAKYYEQTLQSSRIAAEYLDKRGVGVDIQQAFRIGYAGTDSAGLIGYLQSNGVSAEDAVDAGGADLCGDAGLELLEGGAG